MQHTETPSMFYDFLEIGPDALVVADRDGVIVAVNGIAERLFGFERSELIGRSAEILVPLRRRDLFRSQIAELSAGSLDAVPLGPVGLQVASRKDGSEFEVEVAMSQLSTPFGPLVAAALRDITRRREVLVERDRLIAQADRLQQELELARLESLGQLAGRVAHDLNNLLGAILNYTHFVAEEVGRAAAGDVDRPWSVVREDISQIEAATRRAAELSGQLLAFARRDVSRPQRLDVNETLSAMGELIRTTVGTGIDVVMRLGTQVPAVLADPVRLEQVMVSLAVNARDAMPDGGTLTITTDTLPAATPDGDRVRIRLIDDGVGMNADTAGRAFDPFFSTKGAGQVTGLGLTTAASVVAQAGGELFLTSVPGEGTTVTALLVPARD